MTPTVIDRLFLAHPRTAGQSYLQHMRFAWRVAAILFSAAIAAFVHGALPSVLRTSASRTIYRLHDELEQHKRSQSS